MYAIEKSRIKRSQPRFTRQLLQAPTQFQQSSRKKRPSQAAVSSIRSLALNTNAMPNKFPTAGASLLAIRLTFNIDVD